MVSEVPLVPPRDGVVTVLASTGKVGPTGLESVEVSVLAGVVRNLTTPAERDDVLATHWRSAANGYGSGVLISRLKSPVGSMPGASLWP